jgi:hypothetical protein
VFDTKGKKGESYTVTPLQTRKTKKVFFRILKNGVTGVVYVTSRVTQAKSTV